MRLYELRPDVYINLDQIVKIDKDANGTYRVVMTGDIMFKLPEERAKYLLEAAQ